MKTAASWLALACAFACSTDQNASPNGPALHGSGKLRSRARMTIFGDKLYSISGLDGGGLIVFDVADARAPVELGQVTADLPGGGDVAALFSDGQFLFVGGDQPTYIYSVNDSGIPTKLDDLPFTEANYPLIVGGGKAYTIDSELRVIDLANPQDTNIVGTKPMSASNAMGLDGDRLFVCSGTIGLLELNVADPAAILDVTTVPDESCSSLAVVDKTLVVVGTTGISRYDLTTPGLERLSRLP